LKRGTSLKRVETAPLFGMSRIRKFDVSPVRDSPREVDLVDGDDDRNLAALAW
jgi:hypothetical protein